MSSVFKFKKFNVLQKDSALKVGTDSMLLGSIINPKEAKHGLDLGAGTGVLSLMVAQINNSICIDAIEKDLDSNKECQVNFNHSPWSDRLMALNGNYFEFPFNKKYDLIFSNPPFYLEQETNTKKANLISKHTSLIEFEKLASLLLNHLSEKGSFWIILPYNLFKYLEELNVFKPLNIRLLYIIHAKKNKRNSRVVIEFSFKLEKTLVKELIVRNDDNSYTDEYVILTKEFHFNKL